MEPTATQTFTLYGLRDFQVQYWTGGRWATVPGATITGNNLVWRAVTSAGDHAEDSRLIPPDRRWLLSRVTELEAYTAGTRPRRRRPAGTNVALASAGAVATASSTYSSGFLARGVIDGRRSGATWGSRRRLERRHRRRLSGLGRGRFPTSYDISQVNVFSVQDNFTAPVEPTATQTFTLYGLRDFQVQVLDRHHLGHRPGRHHHRQHARVARGHVQAGDHAEDSRAHFRDRRWLLQPRHRTRGVYRRAATPGTSDSLSNRVLVVYNSAVPESLEVADYYMQKRDIPAANKCAIHKTDSLEWFDSLEEYIARRAGSDPRLPGRSRAGEDPLHRFLVRDPVQDDAGFDGSARYRHLGPTARRH